MERVEDGIQGRAVAVVFDAPQLPLDREVGRWSRSRQVRRFARENGASHLLNVRDAEGETWLAGEAGVSFAAAIDAWAEAEAGVADDVVVVPLDERIYAAELLGGLVDAEAVFAPRLLREKLEGWAGRTVRGFEGGRLGETLSGVLDLAAPPFELRARRYRRAAVALSAAGLPTPAQAVAVAALAAAAAGPGAVEAAREWASAETVDAERQADLLAASLEGEFSAATVLRGFAAVGWSPSILLLHRDGLQEVVYEGGFDVELSGRRETGFPAGAERYALALAGHLEVSGGEWRIGRGVGWSAGDRRSVEGFAARRLAAGLHRAAGAARAAVTGSAPETSDGTVEERVYGLRIEGPTPAEFAALAGALENRPFGVRRLRCVFADHLATTCEIDLTAKGVLE